MIGVRGFIRYHLERFRRYLFRESMGYMPPDRGYHTKDHPMPHMSLRRLPCVPHV